MVYRLNPVSAADCTSNSEAVELASQPGMAQKQVGEELGINPGNIGRWKRELAASVSTARSFGGIPDQAAIQSCQQSRDEDSRFVLTGIRQCRDSPP